MIRKERSDLYEWVKTPPLRHYVPGNSAWPISHCLIVVLVTGRKFRKVWLDGTLREIVFCEHNQVGVNRELKARAASNGTCHLSVNELNWPEGQVRHQTNQDSNYSRRETLHLLKQTDQYLIIYFSFLIWYYIYKSATNGPPHRFLGTADDVKSTRPDGWRCKIYTLYKSSSFLTFVSSRRLKYMIIKCLNLL